MIVNEREPHSRAMYWELKRRAPPGVPVYQQAALQSDVWEALDGDKDDFLVYDRWGLFNTHRNHVLCLCIRKVLSFEWDQICWTMYLMLKVDKVTVMFRSLEFCVFPPFAILFLTTRCHMREWSYLQPNAERNICWRPKSNRYFFIKWKHSLKRLKFKDKDPDNSQNVIATCRSQWAQS